MSSLILSWRLRRLQPAIAVVGGVAVFGGVGVASHESTHVRAVGKTTSVCCDQKALGVVVRADFNWEFKNSFDTGYPKTFDVEPRNATREAVANAH